MPDKAIDLIDEAASRVKMEIDSKPTALDEIDRKILQLEIEREALKKESDDASKERLQKIEAEIASEKEKSNGLRAQWESEKGAIAGRAQVARTARRCACARLSRPNAMPTWKQPPD